MNDRDHPARPEYRVDPETLKVPGEVRPNDIADQPPELKALRLQIVCVAVIVLFATVWLLHVVS